jgi:hypothetical protein
MAEVREVVLKIAEDGLAVLGVLFGKEDVLMPNLVQVIRGEGECAI